VYLPGSFKQRLKPRHLLLQADRFAIAGILISSRHFRTTPRENFTLT
jgi:hypothetical protein